MSGFTLFRKYSNDKTPHIKYFDASNYSWKLLERFETKQALEDKVLLLRKELKNIFE